MNVTQQLLEGIDQDVRRVGGIPLLIEQLRSKDLTIKSHILCVIRNVSGNDENEKELVKLGCIKYLVMLLESNNPKMRKDALRTLRNMSFARKKDHQLYFAN